MKFCVCNKLYLWQFQLDDQIWQPILMHLIFNGLIDLWRQNAECFAYLIFIFTYNEVYYDL